ncbi:MAG: pilus assembly protein PilM [Polyangiaceae bacterium]
MARYVGIDLRPNYVRAVLVHASYRKITVERMLEVEVAGYETVDQAISATVVPLIQHSEAVSVAMDGEQTFLHRLRLPNTALKQLAEVIPFELEAQVPVDFDELVYDHRVLKRGGSGAPVIVLTAAARIEQVSARIEQVSRVIGRPVERVAAGALSLSNLVSVCPPVAGPGPYAIVDLGGTHTELVVVADGEPVFARTLSRGVAGLPETAPALAAELRQTAAAFALQGGAALAAVYLVGGGATAPGAEEYLSHELGATVTQLPRLEVEGVGPDLLPALPRFAKAISVALGLTGRARDLDLRRGPLAFQRGYGFLKERVPLLTGLGVAIFVSFAFASWAELRTLSRDEEVLSKAVATLSREVLGQETTDPEEVKNLLDKVHSKDEADPLPPLDAFDVMIELSKAVPSSVTHDVEELDLQRGHVKINGVVGSAQDAQTILSNLKGVRCFNDPKISKMTQVINSDRQKYVLEFEVKCATEKKDAKKKEGGEAAPE